jgi:ligand-binding sensor domain-containing protein
MMTAQMEALICIDLVDKQKKMKGSLQIYALFLMFLVSAFCKGKDRTGLPKDSMESKTRQVTIFQGPKWITRNIIQDRKGNIWIAAFDGIFQYDGKSFTNVTRKVSSARFFSVLEDREGNYWFGSIGSGVYYYDGKYFRNFTTKEGLAGNEVTAIYEDKTGKIWFGTNGGVSCYDGKSFRNFTTKEGLSSNNVNAILQDKTGKFWFGTTGSASVYDGKTFIVVTHNGKPFTNVRSIIEDKKSNIWFGGKDGLWRYNGKVYTTLSRNFVGYIYEDKNGNIWTSAASADNHGWRLFRYDEKSLYKERQAVTEITANKGAFGISEAQHGKIWFGASDGVYSYDGNSITNLTGNQIPSNFFRP